MSNLAISAASGKLLIAQSGKLMGECCCGDNLIDVTNWGASLDYWFASPSGDDPTHIYGRIERVLPNPDNYTMRFRLTQTNTTYPYYSVNGDGLPEESTWVIRLRFSSRGEARTVYVKAVGQLSLAYDAYIYGMDVNGRPMSQFDPNSILYYYHNDWPTFRWDWESVGISAYKAAWDLPEWSQAVTIAENVHQTSTMTDVNDSASMTKPVFDDFASVDISAVYKSVQTVGIYQKQMGSGSWLWYPWKRNRVANELIVDVQVGP
jgi:hypothetical protein